MLSWTEWKERLSWLRNRLTHLSWWFRDRLVDIGRRFVTRPIIATVASLAVLYLGINAYRTWPAPLNWLQGGADGQIIVNSPTVYTRQRLVNDRLSQTTWLQDQLKAADTDFRSVDQFYRSGEQRLRKVEFRENQRPPEGAAKPDTSQPPESRNTSGAKPEHSSIEPLSIRTTTPAEFRAKNLYRDEVRAEITQTQLDDRHDINGNTIYRLAFDATVIAGSRRDALAGIRITLSHKPFKAANDHPAFNHLYDDDYRGLYADWLRYMQTQVFTSIDGYVTSITVGKIDALNLQQLSQFLVQAICERVLEIKGRELDRDAPERQAHNCNPDRFGSNDSRFAIAIENRRTALALLDEQIKPHFDQRQEQSEKDFKSFLKQILGGATEDRLNLYYQQAQLWCRRGNEALFDFNIFPELGEMLRAAKSIPTVPCPSYNSPAVRLKLGILVYNELVRLKDDTHYNKKVLSDSDIKRELIARRKCDADAHKTLCWYAEEQKATRCFAGDFLKASLERSSKSADSLSEKWNRLDYFLKLNVVGRDADECNLLVTETSNPTATVKELKYILNENTEAFAYSVTPKNFTENISTASETRDAFELLAQYGTSAGVNLNATASQMLQRSREMRAILAHPIVVGFSSGTQKPERVTHPPSAEFPNDKDRATTVTREIQVGWIIGPRMRDGQFEQIDNQYALTTVISIPSWWRSVELDIETCWIPRERLSKIRSTEMICEGHEKSLERKTITRMPGAISELSRKLGFDVLQEPALMTTAAQILEIGQPGSLLLRGSRLWRSTEVTLGSQKANSIVVLPNMDGIIAGFRCVLPQLSGGGYDRQPIRVNAYVWTSEGVTTGAPVLLIWPGQNASSPPGADASSARAATPSAADVSSAPAAAPPAADVSSAQAATPPARSPTSNVAAAPSEPRDKQILTQREIRWCPELYPKPASE